MTIPRALVAAVVSVGFLVHQVSAQQALLDASWTVTVNGQQAQVNGNGTVLIPNVAAADQFGVGGPGTSPDFLSDDFLQLLGTRVRNGVTEYAFSERFQIRRGVPYRIRDLTITSTPPPTVVSLDLTIANPVLSGALGQTTQLTTIALVNGGTFVDVTPRTSWTVYRTSNPGVARVGPDGLVTGTGPGTAFLTAVNDGVSAVTRVTVSPVDPLTTVEGVVHLEGGVPVAGALVQIPRFALQATSAADGRFEIPGVPAQQGTFVVTARYTPPQGNPLFASSRDLTPVPGGRTDAGILVVTEPGCQFDADLGIPLPLGDDQVSLHTFTRFSFSYYGVVQPTVWVSSNGNLQFGGNGDGSYNPSIPGGVVNGVARLSPAFFDLNPAQGGGVYLREANDRLVVTWFQIPEYNTGGSNTIQAVLHANGRIDVVYNGVQHLGTTFRPINVAISAGGTPTVRMLDFTATVPFAAAATEAPFERFGQVLGNPFDLDLGCLSFLPNAGNGYDVSFRRIPTLRDGGALGVIRDAAGAALAETPFVVTSSSDPAFRFFGKTDKDGCFQLAGLPRPGVVCVMAGTAASPSICTRLLRTSSDRPWIVVAPLVTGKAHK
ncbi:MAG: carboxypeptidase regulatory-like domain-containing protein [Planctomycetes bacterium]|nr:carboxypeptidase regulatory-like domain-containing protein [Planctomycetota bacterium]